jgi:hypothetical protein
MVMPGAAKTTSDLKNPLARPGQDKSGGRACAAYHRQRVTSGQGDFAEAMH